MFFRKQSQYSNRKLCTVMFDHTEAACVVVQEVFEGPNAVALHTLVASLAEEEAEKTVRGLQGEMLSHAVAFIQEASEFDTASDIMQYLIAADKHIVGGPSIEANIHKVFVQTLPLYVADDSQYQSPEQIAAWRSHKLKATQQGLAKTQLWSDFQGSKVIKRRMAEIEKYVISNAVAQRFKGDLAELDTRLEVTTRNEALPFIERRQVHSAIKDELVRLVTQAPQTAVASEEETLANLTAKLDIIAADAGQHVLAGILPLVTKSVLAICDTSLGGVGR